MVAGSGTVLMVPVISMWDVGPLTVTVTVPLPRRSPVNPANDPVPPVTVNMVVTSRTVPGVGGSGPTMVPSDVPDNVSPLPKSNVNSPLKVVPVATFVQ
jgi:hypothetical protein